MSLSSFAYFLCNLPLIFRVGWKCKIKTGWRYLQGDPKYRIWTRLISSFSSYVRQRIENKKLYFFFSFRNFFSEIADSVILLDVDCTINPQIFNQNRWSQLWENRNFYFFFLCELPLNLGYGENLKKKTVRDIWKRTLHIEFERDWSIRLGVNFQW